MFVAKTFDVLIENTTNQYGYKYEYDPIVKRLKIDRLLTGRKAHFCNYGFIINTWSSTEKHLDAMVITVDHLWRIPINVVVTCRALGVLDMHDEEGYDPKILCIPIANTAGSHIINYDAVPTWILEGWRNYFLQYKRGSNNADSISVGNYRSSEDAYKLISEYWNESVDI